MDKSTSLDYTRDVSVHLEKSRQNFCRHVQKYAQEHTRNRYNMGPNDMHSIVQTLPMKI